MTHTDGFLWMFLLLYVGQSVFNIWVERINGIHRARFSGSVPAGFEDFVDGAKLAQMSAYASEKSRLDIAGQLASDGILLIVLFSGFLPVLVRELDAAGLSLLPAGLVFFLVTGLVESVAEIPFSYYNTFILEEKFGFNRQTRKLWLIDLLKSGMLGAVLSAVVLSALLCVIALSPGFWWVWGFLIVSSVQLLLTVLYPVVIAPLFNKFEPVRDESLSGKIVGLMEQNGIRVEKVLQMNAGVRSRHTNAYFTGIGGTKQIVLYDTLLQSHTHEEILAVLAHEAGHFKKKHVLKQLIIFEAFLLGGFYLTYLLIQYQFLYTAFGFSAPVPYAGLFLAGVLWRKAGFFIQPFYMELLRRFETEADVFAVNMLGTASPMMEALKRLAADNLSNLNPHRVYVWFHYSHPPIVERVAALESVRVAAKGPEGVRAGGP